MTAVTRVRSFRLLHLRAILLFTAGFWWVFIRTLAAQDAPINARSVKNTIDFLTNHVMDNCVYECDITYSMTASFKKDAKKTMPFTFARSGDDIVVESVTPVSPKGELRHQTVLTDGRLPVRISYEPANGKNKISQLEALARTNIDYFVVAMEGTGIENLLRNVHPSNISIQDLPYGANTHVFDNNTAIFKTEYGQLLLAFTKQNQVLLDSISLVQGPTDRFSASANHSLREITSDQRSLPGSKEGLISSNTNVQIYYKVEGKVVTLSRLQTKWKLVNSNGHVELVSDLQIKTYMKVKDASEVRKRMVAVPNGSPVRLMGDANEHKVQAMWKDGAIVRVVDGKVIEAIRRPVGFGRTRLYLVLAAIALVACAAALIVRRYHKLKRPSVAKGGNSDTQPEGAS